MPDNVFQLLLPIQNEVLKVIRRVDDNWVEGQKGDKIGIFPISFVEVGARLLNSS